MYTISNNFIKIPEYELNVVIVTIVLLDDNLVKYIVMNITKYPYNNIHYNLLLHSLYINNITYNIMHNYINNILKLPAYN